jgi:Dolichyl-phosphate-mannose-protein mannosyltransferase
VFTVLRDLTEPLAFALVALAVLAWDERRTGRLVVSAVLFALAALTRETVLPFAAAAAAALVVADARRTGRWRDWRTWRRGLFFGAAAVGPLLAWRAILAGSLHERTKERGGAGWAVPFHGILSYWPWDPQHRVALLTVVFPALAALAGALVPLWRGRAPVAATLLAVNVLLFVVFLPKPVYADYAAAARASVGVVLAALYCLPAWWGLGAHGTYRAAIVPRALVLAVAVAWSLAWYLPVARHYGLSGIDLITT